MSLSYNEFLEFFRYKHYTTPFKDNKNVFNLNFYNKIKDYLRLLNYEAFLIWDELFNTHESIKIRKRLFESDEDNEITKYNAYLKNEEAYLEMRRRIKKLNIKFVTSDLAKLDIKEKFDNIWLSNIGTYYKEIDEFKNKV